MSQPTRAAPQDKEGQSLLMGTGAGEAVQQSSDAAKDDRLPRLEGEGVGLLTTTVQKRRRVIDEKIKSEVPSPQTLSLYT